MSNIKLFVASFFKNKHGKVVLWQAPNVPLYSWAGLRLISLVVPFGHVRVGFEQLSTAALFVWAYLEITEGVSSFRKLIGLVVLATIVSSYFS